MTSGIISSSWIFSEFFTSIALRLQRPAETICAFGEWSKICAACKLQDVWKNKTKGLELNAQLFRLLGALFVAWEKWWGAIKHPSSRSSLALPVEWLWNLSLRPDEELDTGWGSFPNSKAGNGKWTQQQSRLSVSVCCLIAVSLSSSAHSAVSWSEVTSHSSTPTEQETGTGISYCLLLALWRTRRAALRKQQHSPFSFFLDNTKKAAEVYEWCTLILHSHFAWTPPLLILCVPHVLIL